MKKELLPVNVIVPKTIMLPCLQCGKKLQFNENSNEAKGIFNVFCHGKDCEDRYAMSH